MSPTQACVKWPQNGTCWMAFSPALTSVLGWTSLASLSFFHLPSIGLKCLCLDPLDLIPWAVPEHGLHDVTRSHCEPLPHLPICTRHDSAFLRHQHFDVNIPFCSLCSPCLLQTTITIYPSHPAMACLKCTCKSSVIYPFSSLMRMNSSFNLVFKTHCIHPLSFYLQSGIIIDELNSPSTTQTHRQRHLFITRESLDLQHHEDPANVYEIKRRYRRGEEAQLLYQAFWI